MTLDQLRVFVAVATHLNMTRASENLHLTQPAVSAAIAALEGRYSVPLFHRVGRKLELTEAGGIFLSEAKSILCQVENAARTLADLAGLQSGELRLSASQTLATYWLPPRMSDFAALYPAIALPLFVGNTVQTVSTVAQGRAELGFIEGEFDNPDIESRIIGGDRLGLYVAPDHPLAQSPPDRDALSEASWILREQGSGTRDHFMASLPGLGLRTEDIDVRLELPSNGAVLEAVQRGQHVAAVSDLAAHSRRKVGLLTRLNLDLPMRNFRLIMHKERYLGKAAQAFIQLIAEPADTALAI